MSKLEIVLYPDPRLRKKSSRVEKIDEGMKQLALDMLNAMYDGNGVGLAAPQVGKNIRLLVADPGEKGPPNSDLPKIFFNPEIVSAEGETIYDEGCLSLPDLAVTMRRNKRITVNFQDENGEQKQIVAEDFFAIIIQHEADHLDGKLIIDKLSNIEQDIYLRKLRKTCPSK